MRLLRVPQLTSALLMERILDVLLLLTMLFSPHFYSNGTLKDLWRNTEKKQNKKIITLVGAAWEP